MKFTVLMINLILLSLQFSCYRPAIKSANQSPQQLEKAKLKTFKEIERSILKLTCSAYYENYYYDPPLRLNSIIPQDSLFIEKKFTTNSVAGTGLILVQHIDKILILTCQHIFDFEDTLKTYYIDKNKKVTNYLQSLSIKYGQTIYVSHRNGTISRAKIVAQDAETDIALIETKAVENVLSEFPFQGRFNNGSKIELGQEVYLLGFPKSHFLITKGLASPSKYKNKFIVDIPFNRGFSGGVTISFDYQKGIYQYVGMANSTAYDSRIVLAPSDEIVDIEALKTMPYVGDIYVKELKLINHGITFVIRRGTIINFLKREQKSLKLFGFPDISNIIK